MMAVLIEQPELENSPMFQNLWLRTFQWQKFEEILRPYLLEHDWEDLLTRAQELRVPFAPVMHPAMLLENEHLKERRFFEPVDQPGIGELPLAGGPFKMQGTPLRYGPAPALGEHTAELLAEAGYEPGDAVILRERGVA
jgi:crotonobetainyl-CoA:carnitine CoA-transferase CaiB-like acyl-CoA transferase